MSSLIADREWRRVLDFRPRSTGGEDRRRRLWIEWFATAVFSTSMLIVLIWTGATTRFDNAIYDVGLRLKQTRPRADIVIVAMDPDSIRRAGEWPWPRRVVATLVANVARDDPKALACYFIYLFHTTPADDAALSKAMARTRTFVAVPRPGDSRGPAGVLKPIPEILKAVAGVGIVDAEPDRDGIVRRTHLFEGGSNGLTSRLALQMARLSLAEPQSANAFARYRDREMLIPYVGSPGSYATVPAYSVLAGQVPKGFFTNKYVLFGATAPELLDSVPTPMSTAASMPDVEVDANILNGLLSGTRIVAVSRPVELLISGALLWLLLIALVRLGPRDNLWLAAAMSGLPTAGAIVGVVFLGIWAPPSPYLVTLGIVIPYWGWRRLNAASAYFAEELRSLEENAGGAVLAQSREAASVGGDVVLQQMTLLEETKRRIADLRRFVVDILANFPDPVLVVDVRGKILTVNQAALDFALRSRVSADQGASISAVLARIAPMAKDGRPFWPPSEPSARPDRLDQGRPLTGEGPEGRAYEVRITPTVSGSGQPTGWIVHLADITTLVSAMRQREEALQLLSHDMRSPLSAIVATLNHPDFRDAPADLRQRIEGQAGRSLDLADAFVRLAKAESETYVFEPIDFGHVLQDAADSVWSLAQAAEVRVMIELDDVEFVVFADRSLLTRAVVNLLDNAVKFSPRGERVLCRLVLADLDGRKAVSCEIADRAGGMAAAELASLFRKFVSSRDAHGRSAGVGLGLALVQTVVARHDGRVKCESADGEGSVFTITLPLYDEAGEEASTLGDAPVAEAAHS